MWGEAAMGNGQSDAKLVLVDQIEPLIATIRGQKVLLDRDLAVLYGVPTKRLNEQVRRNKARFPQDFMFRLTDEEAEALGRKMRPHRRGTSAFDRTSSPSMGPSWPPPSSTRRRPSKSACSLYGLSSNFESLPWRIRNSAQSWTNLKGGLAATTNRFANS